MTLLRFDQISLEFGDQLILRDAELAIEPGEQLTLMMEKKAPGAGVLEFRIRDNGDARNVQVCGYWHPAGVWGLLYWYLTLPIHSVLFKGTAREIARRASAAGTPGR